VPKPVNQNLIPKNMSDTPFPALMPAAPAGFVSLPS